jgi:hypothetical protein
MFSAARCEERPPARRPALGGVGASAPPAPPMPGSAPALPACGDVSPEKRSPPLPESGRRASSPGECSGGAAASALCAAA